MTSLGAALGGWSDEGYKPKGRVFGVHFDSERYEEIEPGIYRAYDVDPTAPQFEVHISGTFGDAYLA